MKETPQGRRLFYAATQCISQRKVVLAPVGVFDIVALLLAAIGCPA